MKTGPPQPRLRTSTERAPHLVENPAARTGELTYFVEFDEPQYDSGGDGPYRKASIWDRYLERLD